MLLHTSAEIREMYRRHNPDMPSDEVLASRYGNAEIGAGEWLREQGIYATEVDDNSEAAGK